MNSDNIKTISDEELVLLMQNGNHSAYKELYNRYWLNLFRIAYSKIGDKDICENIIQDIFTNLWVRREKIILSKKLSAYLHTALKYVIINHFNAINVRRKYSAEKSKIKNINSYNTERLVAYNELYTAIENEVNNLPNRCAEVFRLSRYENLSNKEIAKKLEISPKTVENQITKAIKVLRLHLKEVLSLFIL
ncbi:RNA polymerase sigma-70 factor [Wocania ichthyoenteri]|uniref:RNA polymerase sigma-70 factor n=1 Tax=Wocania ichthyoenteri TaxID=1230531 RepID=UPI00068BCA8C|nr:RNA polymerase sigma-70 factor [Wocania ichthyoenteri]